jgi:hypothetical protein
MTLLHTTRPPATTALIVRFSADLAQQDQSSAWSGARSCVSVISGKDAQSSSMSWGWSKLRSLLPWWIMPSIPATPWVWCYVSDLPALLESMLNPQAPAAGPDLAPELEVIRARVKQLEQAILRLMEDTK